MLKVSTQVQGDIFIVRCAGRIVFGDEGAAFRERLAQLLTGTPKLLVNLASVEYVDSRGLGILVGLFVSSLRRGGELKLVAPTKRVEEVLRRTRLDGVFKVHSSEEDAIAEFSATNTSPQA
ncbi:MAG TPA: STAS domain-containing protein [Terriglobales bacterium]|nr:STAS domain-containing protein [Terriglobales bacterium]